MFTLRTHVCLFYSHFLSSNRASASICNICNGKAHTPAFLFCILLCTVICKWDQNKYLETFCNSVILSRQITSYYTIWVLVWLFNWYDLKRSVLFWYIVKHLEWLSQFTLQYSLQLERYILAQGIMRGCFKGSTLTSMISGITNLNFRRWLHIPNSVLVHIILDITLLKCSKWFHTKRKSPILNILWHFIMKLVYHTTLNYKCKPTHAYHWVLDIFNTDLCRICIWHIICD